MKYYSKGASFGSQVEHYIRSLRNRAKKKYANSYAHFLANGNAHIEPDHPVELSYMAAQAVRCNILEIINSEV